MLLLRVLPTFLAGPRRLRHRTGAEDGASMVEYLLMLAVGVTLVLVVYPMIRDAVRDQATCVTTAAQSGQPCIR